MGRAVFDNGRAGSKKGGAMINTVVGLEWFFTIVAAEISIFFFDVSTREDDVSIGFLYTLPTLMGFFVKDRALQNTIVATSIVLIIFGCFIPVPVHEDLPVFIANRILSVVTVLITGIMVNFRVKLERTLADALAKEKSASATQRAFVSMVSHEFRTPLTIIDGEAYRMIKTKETIVADDIERRAKSIRSSVTRMVNLIEGVLYSTRAQENSIVLHVERVNLRSLIRSVCHEQARVSPDHFVEYIVAGLPAAVKGDRNLLSYVFDNLVGNAIKYSPAGSVVTVNGEVVDAQAVVIIRDSGIGIPAEDLPRLFEPYFRAGNASGFSGSGVGLYIVQTFVKLHGGRVTVESTVGQGSVFTVYLPVDGAK
ncbi:MAG: HAMP domain-containing sensor histidine kinase [Rhodospirillaceae bacterium]